MTLKKASQIKPSTALILKEAQALWNDANRLEIAAKTIDEPRCIVIGMIGNKHWSAVITQRGSHIRIISVRRSRDEEVKYYESE